MKRGSAVRDWRPEGTWEAQLRGGRSRVTPNSAGLRAPLALSSSLKCKRALQLLMRENIDPGPAAGPRCVRVRGDVGEGPTWAPRPAVPLRPRARPPAPRRSRSPASRPVCPDVTRTPVDANMGLRATSPRSREWRNTTARGSERGDEVGRASRGDGRLRLPGRRGWRPGRPTGSHAPLCRLPPTP